MTDETRVESVLIAMLTASPSPVLAGLLVHHADDNTRTDAGEETVTEYIAVAATKGDRLLDGAQCLTYEVSVEYRSTALSEEIDEKMKAIEESIETPGIAQRDAGIVEAVRQGLKFFQVEPSARSARDADGLTRTRSRQWTVIAA